MTDEMNGSQSVEDGRPSNSPQSPLPAIKSPEVSQMRKLKLILSKLLEPEFKASDDTVLCKLFTLLSNRISALDDKAKLAELTLFVPWLCMVRKHWKGLKGGVRVFALRIAGLVGSTPSGFFTLFEAEILKAFCTFVKHDQVINDASIQLSYLEMLTAVSVHSSGWHWIVETGVWKGVIDLTLMDSSLYVFRQGTQFLSNLILILETSDITLCHQILDTALVSITCEASYILPVDGNSNDVLSTQTAPVPTSNRKVQIPAVKLVSEVLTTMLMSKMKPDRVQGVLGKYKLEDWAWWRLHDESNDIELINAISKMLCLLHTATISRNDKGEVPYSVMRSVTLLALRHLHLVILKHFFTLVLDVCVEYQILWHKFGGPIIENEEDLQQEAFYIENNLIITQAMPTFITMKVTRVMESDVMDLFAEKVFSLSCTETQRVCYAYRDCLRESTDRSLEALCLQGILSFSRVINVVKREQAVMIFQCMMHTLKEFVPEEVSDFSADCIVARRHTQSLVMRFPSILRALLDGLIKFLNSFSIKWRDSLETVCILNFLQGLITNPHISPMLCSKALQLTRLVITRFIPPNLALLVDTLQGSSIGDLGKQLLKKLHDIHWEVRDSALEVLQAIASLAESKFPAFQTLILENDLPRVVVGMATEDSDGYVRASAITCLIEMVKIQSIWDSALFNQKLLDKMLKILVTDTEGLVRHQAALLIAAIYKHQAAPPALLERVFDTMCHIAVYDLHWEVKIGALEFWSGIIHSYQTQEGMIDGMFPEVTFSRQARKIVTLDPPEIRKRLLRVLKQLSTCGCLHVLWKSLKDECDLEVVKKSSEIIKNLLGLLRKYDLPSMIPKEPATQTSFQAPEAIDSSGESTEEDDEIIKPNMDKIIDEIVGEEDINLLSAKVSLGRLNSNVIKLKPRILLSPEDFVSSLSSMNLDKYLKEKLDWVSVVPDSLESLLDDIIIETVNKDTTKNMLDCY